mmetsp:Transcript_15540/g.25943  ORF Transcript_15540/g.25943 Transcript_15540/m.25943 type:complete len:237 (-) Transcript_15540:145-855(-)|eukprot:CAMPEP_0119310202 /NCGR_PEP_ID=MMETSP1333-20130426/18047_1 /TAXON_ID=418940 /ORGANISM="Scyphosphaera apsteinii, Strain RCC1455" /LENGTH=236 /DNA_ID=CAMNT_0007314341 /DNA_START=45 /DNA_END=755 /DNA_ORIENTATION=+
MSDPCRLLSGVFPMLVQICLALAAVCTLVYKRHKERPRRAWIVWFFDASKQAFAGLLQHMVNLAFGVAFAVGATASECAWYLLNFCISVGCGVVILYGAMAVYKNLVDRFNIDLLKSGEYGKPPSWKPWLAQLLVWGFISVAEKYLTAVVVILPLHSHLDLVASMMETPVARYPNLELIIVMVLAPAVLNAVFFWLIDNIIMRRRPKHDGHDDPRAPLLDDDSCCCVSVGRNSHRT